MQPLNGEGDAGPGAEHADLTRALAPLTVIRTTSPLDHRSSWFEVFPPGVTKATGAAYYLCRAADTPPNAAARRLARWLGETAADWAANADARAPVDNGDT